LTKRDWVEKFGLKASLINHVPCFGQNTGRVNVTMTGGVAPHLFVVEDPSVVSKIETDTVFSGGGRVVIRAQDARGCVERAEVEVLPALPFVAKFYFSEEGDHWYYYNLQSDHDNGVPPILDMWNHMRHASFLNSRMHLMPAGKYSLISADLNECVSRASIVLEEKKPHLCPNLNVCQQKISWHHSFYVRCLRKLASPLLWNTSNWDLCSARAAFDLVRQLHINFDTFGITQVDNGAMFVANLLGEAVHKCNAKFGENVCDFPWRLIEPYFRENNDAMILFNQKNFSGVFSKLLHLNDTSPAELLTIAP
jgi:hypothetical protein